jgi:hypothetical protein
MVTAGTARYLNAGQLLMKAATATNIDLPEHGWLDDLIAKTKGSTFDMNTDTGVRLVMYVPADGSAPIALSYDVPKQYGEVTFDTVKDALGGEEDVNNRAYPNSAPVYAHRYEENEIVDAFKAMPSGARCTCQVRNAERNWVEVTLEKTADGFAYAGAAEGLPEPAALYANPGRYLLPWSLDFVLPA